MSQKTVERNFAWTNQVELWAGAYSVNPTSAHTCQNYGINLSITGQVPKAVAVLSGAVAMPLVDRMDCDEIFPTLAMCLNALNRPLEALAVLSRAHRELEEEQAARVRGVKIWHMHELLSSTSSSPATNEELPLETPQEALRRGRLLAVQATVLFPLDAKEACVAALLGVRLAPGDLLVRRLVSDLEAKLTRGGGGGGGVETKQHQQQQNQQAQPKFFK
mmetsp:Transcript_44863/g.83167  ORF Transcript_44863/g.83167 Transcript_44863/m.83167 type:complete len:219 (-) Transcript_44863:172-828(-)